MTDLTRRRFLQRIVPAAALVTAHPLNLLAEKSPRWNSDEWRKEFPGSWPAPEEKLYDIPLIDPLGTKIQDTKAVRLLVHKINTGILNNDEVVGHLKQQGIWPIPKGVPFGGTIARHAMEVFDENTMKEFYEHPGWDKHPDESVTVGNVWRRFWQRAANHYHENDLKNQFDIRKKSADAPYHAILRQYIGEETAGKIERYADVDFKTLNPKDEKAFAFVTRSRPMLDFPHFVKALGLKDDLLKITREDLEAIGVHVDEELNKLRQNSVAWTDRAVLPSTSRGKGLAS